MEHQPLSVTKAPIATSQSALVVAPGARTTPELVYSFHRLGGNQAVGRMVQTKLSISEPGDAFEQEADQVADRVMRMPDAGVQRKCAACGTGGGSCAGCNEEQGSVQLKHVQRQAVPEPEEEEMPLQAKSAHASQSTVAPKLAIEAAQNGGEPLGDSARAFFEPRFGYNFSHVRVHSSEDAGASARSVNALAYTLGHNIVFGAGQYSPGTDSGDRLLAHELAHVIQQGSALRSRGEGAANYQSSTHRTTAEPAFQRQLQRLAEPAIQRQTDSAFESQTGVGAALAAGDMLVDSSVNGLAVTANDCGQPGCNITFRFDKGYKGDYTALENGSQRVRGVYAKISASYDAAHCGTCDQIKLLQVIRRTQRADEGEGELEAADPRHSRRRALAGWRDPSAGSAGWFVDTPIQPGNATTRQPYATSFRLGGLELAHPGSATDPAVLWDCPGDWADRTNTGADLETCAICSRSSGHESTLACVHWGFYTDNDGVVSFEPSTLTVNCGITLELVNAVERFEQQPGNRPSDLDFVGLCLSPSSWTGPTKREFTQWQESRVIAMKYAASTLASQALLGVSSGDRYMATLARRIFQVSSPDMNDIADKIQLILGTLRDLRVTCGTCADSVCNRPGVVAYVPDDLSRVIICPRFFLLDLNDMRRTLTYHAGNIVGVDPSRGADGRLCRETRAVECHEPCENLSGGLMQNADVWARFIECAGFSR